MKILYVENHAVFAALVTRKFLGDHEVMVVPSLSEARTCLGEQVYDVLLVDYDLDDGKGSELVAELRASSDATPIVAVSSHDEGNQRILEAGADAICKKTDFAGIGEVLARLAEGR